MTSAYTPETFKPLLKLLHSTPELFTPELATAAFEHLALGPSGATEAQIGAFLTALTLSKLDQRADMITACAKVMRRYSIPVETVADAEGLVVDIVGTGGDGHDTFNVSTSAGIVAAGAGAVVCKHGNKASTSSSGSADLLIALTCPLTFPPSSLSKILTPATPFAFLFASLYHPSMALLAPIRKSLPFRTVFNVLGPLINPARPSGMVIGVYTKELGPVFAEALKELGVKRALVVCGQEGLDEISPAGETWAWSLENGAIIPMTLHPTHDFGLPLHPLRTVRGGLGGSSAANALTLLALLTNAPAPADQFPANVSADDPEAPSFDAIRDFILINASAVLVVAGKANDFKEGVKLARESLEGGGALRALEEFKRTAGEAVASTSAFVTAAGP